MAASLAYLGMAVGSAGIFAGFWLLSDDPSMSLRIVTLTTVGVVGVLAWIRHVVFHRADAARLGWQTERPDWMFEVGFANLGFGLMGIAAATVIPSPSAQVVTLAGYSFYLLQAAMLHGYRYFTDTERHPARLWRSCVATLCYVAAMGFFAVAGAIGV